jgi:hypothetical protein
VGVTAAFLWGKQGCRKGVPTKHGPRSVGHGPIMLVPQIHWGAISFSDRSDSIFRKHS